MTTSQRQAQKYTAYLWVVAEDTVDRLWSEIEALAHELLARKTMTGAEVIAFQQAWRPAQLETEGPLAGSARAASRSPEPFEGSPTG
jgi:hypothetical protein